MKKLRATFAELGLLIAFGLAGCGESGAVGGPQGAAPAEDTTASSKTYDKGVRLRACEAMPIETVVRLFQVPAEELERGGGKYGCRYSRDTDDHAFYAELSSISILDDVEKAKRRYGDFTLDATQEQVDALKEEVDQKVEKDESLGEGEKKTAFDLTGLMAAATPDGGVKHTSIEGLADEAKIDNEYATIRLRSGNMIFYIRAYNGPRQPRSGTTNIQEMMAEELAWNAKVLPDRARDAIALAREVVPMMESFGT